MLRFNATITTFGLGLVVALAGAAIDPTAVLKAEDSVPIRILQESEHRLLYAADGIPYPFEFNKKTPACFFSDRELRLFQETFRHLPEVYQNIPEDFVIQKRCELSDPATVDRTARVKVAMTKKGVLIFKDRTFLVVKEGGTLHQLSDRFSKQIITHELTHALDRTQKLSKSKSFKQVNAWARNWFLRMRASEYKNEGFYRDQGAKGPHEDLTTAAEGYFFDPQFMCEHPAMYMWFSAHVGPTPVEQASCDELNTPLDPEKITGVGYMLVSASDIGMESRFGHAVLHIHDADNDPFNDILVQGAGNFPGAPIITDDDSPETQEAKRQVLMKIGRLDFLFKGVLGQLDFVATTLKYREKWLNTVIIEGRDIREKLLKLSPDQLRAIALIVNRDIQRALGNYKFVENNCATYIGETLNKVFASDLVSKNWLGAYTPRRVYNDVTPVMDKELPVVEGDLTRLAKLLPKRFGVIEQLKQDEAFSQVDWAALHELKDSDREVQEAKIQLALLADIAKVLSDTGQLTLQRKTLLKTLYYTFNVERNMMLKAHSLNLYKMIANLSTGENNLNQDGLL